MVNYRFLETDRRLTLVARNHPEPKGNLLIAEDSLATARLLLPETYRLYEAATMIRHSVHNVLPGGGANTFVSATVDRF